jgi:hypothetical protein
MLVARAVALGGRGGACSLVARAASCGRKDACSSERVAAGRGASVQAGGGGVARLASASMARSIYYPVRAPCCSRSEFFPGGCRGTAGVVTARLKREIVRLDEMGAGRGSRSRGCRLL